MKIAQNLLAAAVLLSTTGATQAALVDRGSGLIYDTDLNVTWLSNANANGFMTWDQANTWATNLSVLDSVRNQTLTGWRLPTTLQPDATCSDQEYAGISFGMQSGGYNCTGSEMGHLFYNELGGVAGQAISTTHNTNFGLFQNLFPSVYWSGTESAAHTSYAWFFYFGAGSQDYYIGNGVNIGKAIGLYALAVRPGDVAAVPVPAAAWLMGSGLLGLIGVARRKAGY